MNTLSKLFLGLLSLVGLVACQQNKKEGTQDKKELHSGIIEVNMDTLVKPGDDFMEYVNGGWLSRTKIPDDKSSFGSFINLRDMADENVKGIIDSCAAGDFKDGTDSQKVGDLYKSYMDIDRRNSLGVKPLDEELQKIDAIKGYDGLAEYFGYAVKYGYRVPLNVGIQPDYKNPTMYTAMIVQGGLGLPDREYYLKDTDDFKEIRQKYLEHIEKMFDLAGIKNSKAEARTILSLETRLAQKQLAKEKMRDRVSMYHMVPTDSLSAIMPNFDWKSYLMSVGIGDQKKLVVYGWEYEKGLNSIIKSTEIGTWKTYLKWGVLNSSASLLTEALEKQNFDFYSKVLRGVPKQLPLWQRGVALVNRNEGEIVGKMYVKKYFPPAAKQRMETLVGNLVKAYEESIKDLDWMSEGTRTKALEKLHKFTPKIGYPDEWRNYDALTIDKNDLFGNVRRADLFDYNRNLKKLGKPIDRKEWHMTPQTVNAYYNPSMNEIVFPAAILQPPFFDMDAEDAVNYGGIGAVIGHEIGHGFDDKGSTFDGDGKLQNWWTDTDRTEFKKRTNALVAQYNSFEVLPDLFLNGEYTQGENIGDLSGLTIGNKAYKMSLNGKKGPTMDGYTAEQRLFIGYAQLWCMKSRDEALREQVNTNPHSPAKFRVNGVVRNVPDFYTAFNVQPGDSLYLAPKDRVKIW